MSEAAGAVALLRDPATIRERCGQVFDAARRGALAHFDLDLDRLPAAVAYVRDVTLANYPGLDIPFHSRWRHFDAGGIARWPTLDRAVPTDPAENARRRFDLAVTSVLLDAGAGPAWVYREHSSGREFSRSEGLAVASFELFRAGFFSDRPGEPMRADAAALERITAGRLAEGLQVSDANPLTGIDGRASLLRRLGSALMSNPVLFGANAPRIGNLAGALAARADRRPLPAKAILAAVLEGFQWIWPARLAIGGVPLGDVGHHPAVRGPGETDGLVPFHKLSQWLTYSLIEPLEDAGVKVVDVDALTGLPEYRNGGLFIDLGVLRPKFASRGVKLDPLSEPIVEWRALTVALLDRLAEDLRLELKLDAVQLPIAKVLQGGTWAAGRKIAAARRPGGASPIDVASDGTLF